MKDAKGHGSNKRGGMAKVSVDPAKLGFRMADIGPGGKEHNVVTGGARFNVDPKTGTTPAQRAAASREMFGTGHAKVARIAQQHGIQGGPFKVQALNLKLAGQPFQTVKSFKNNTVAEHVAKYMSVDGAHTRLR